MNHTDDQLKRDAVSDTPRTDDTFDAYTRGIAGSAYIRASMQKLERELAAVTAERDEISLRREESVMANEQMLSDLSAVTAERDVLKADLCAFAVDMEKQLSASQQEARRLREALCLKIQQET